MRRDSFLYAYVKGGISKIQKKATSAHLQSMVAKQNFQSICRIETLRSCLNLYRQIFYRAKMAK